jgi:hypothetical protein
MFGTYNRYTRDIDEGFLSRPPRLVWSESKPDADCGQLDAKLLVKSKRRSGS